MKVLVTGGAGFIGANYVKNALEKKWDVALVDKLTYAGNPQTIEQLKNIGDFKFYKEDICSQESIEKIFKEFVPEAVVHFAAESHVTRSDQNPDIFYETNVKGTKTLLDTAAKFAPNSRFVHISTDEVYGDIVDGFFAEEDKLKGDSQARSAYAKSKSIADDLALESSDKLDVMVIRATNNFGPFQYPEKFLPRMITSVMEGRNIKLWDGGTQVRDWLFAPDTANGINLLIEKGKRGEAYNIGANNSPEISNKELSEWIIKSFELDDSRIEHVQSLRPHHDVRYGVRTDKIRSLGWSPSKDVWSDFLFTLNWYKENQDWWTPLIKEAESIYSGN